MLATKCNLSIMNLAGCFLLWCKPVKNAYLIAFFSEIICQIFFCCLTDSVFKLAFWLLISEINKINPKRNENVEGKVLRKAHSAKGGGAKVVRHFYNMLKQWKGWKYSRRVRERMGKQAYSIKHVDPHFSHPIYRILNFTPACTLNNWGSRRSLRRIRRGTNKKKSHLSQDMYEMDHWKKSTWCEP